MFHDHCVERELSEEDINNVVQDIASRAKEYGFKPKGHALLDAAYESAALSGFDVDEDTARQIAAKAKAILI